jgi:hypothetical protein
VTDENCFVDECIVEDTRDVVGEIGDRYALRIARRGGSAMSSIMRMQGESIVFA